MIAWVPPGYQVILYGCDIALLSGGLGDVDDIVVGTNNLFLDNFFRINCMVNFATTLEYDIDTVAAES